MTTLTFTATGDGDFFEGDATWAGARGDSQADSLQTTDVVNYVESYVYPFSGDYFIRRPLLIFDTAGTLADDAVITDARIKIYVVTVFSVTQGDVGLSIVSAVNAEDGSVTTADYNDFGTSAVSDEVTITGGWRTFTLTQDGIDLIKKSGSSYTAFGIRTNLDLENTSPVLDTLGVSATFASNNNSDSTKRPILEVDLPGAVLKRYNGSAWENAHLKRYDGANFVDVNFKYYDGSAFQTVYTKGV